MITLAKETPDDWWEVEALFDLCFAPGRTALSSYRLRNGVDPISDLCFAARDTDNILAGAVRNWPVYVGSHLVILLGPVAVHPTRQGEGLGGFMLREVVYHAQALGARRVMLVGDAPYYQRFGFERLDGVLMPPPTNPDRVLGQALVPGGWDDVSGDVTAAPDCNWPKAPHL